MRAERKDSSMLSKTERQTMYQVWTYLRDYATTPEGKSLMQKVNQMLKNDIQRRKKLRKQD